MAMTHPSSTTLANEPVMAMPTSGLLGAVVAAGVVVALAWSGGCILLRMDADVMRAGVSGAAVVTLVGLGGVLVMAPWIPRTITAWTSTWIGSTLFRMVLTPLCTWLLYSATSLSTVPLALAVASAYLVVLLVEAAVIARVFNRPATPDHRPAA